MSVIVLGIVSAIVSIIGADQPPQWALPVATATQADVVRGFDPPEQPWLSGHRGVDISAPAGSVVSSAGAGTVTYTGEVAGRGVVVVNHGSLRTTYEPVTPSVRKGERVDAGSHLGTLNSRGSHCTPNSCLHWGAKIGDDYRNPLALINAPTVSSSVRLVPLGNRAITGDPPPPPSPPTAATRLRWPVTNPRVTSPYGMRVHPVTGVYKLHDGTDFSARCGTPIRAAAAGQVASAGPRGAYGIQVTIAHGNVESSRLATSYSHLSRVNVSPGTRVEAGQIIGNAGTTGSSTGCHLHFMVTADGSVDNPMRWLK